MENLEDMEEPTPCIHCGEWFDLSDGYGSEKWHPNNTICGNCRDQEIKEVCKDEEIEDLTANLSDAEDNVIRYRKRLRELGVQLPETKAEKWDKLEEKVSEYYKDGTDDTIDDEYDDGLLGIGEASARAFGYL